MKEYTYSENVKRSMKNKPPKRRRRKLTEYEKEELEYKLLFAGIVLFFIVFWIIGLS